MTAPEIDPEQYRRVHEQQNALLADLDAEQLRSMAKLLSALHRDLVFRLATLEADSPEWKAQSIQAMLREVDKAVRRFGLALEAKTAEAALAAWQLGGYALMDALGHADEKVSLELRSVTMSDAQVRAVYQHSADAVKQVTQDTRAQLTSAVRGSALGFGDPGYVPLIPRLERVLGIPAVAARRPRRRFGGIHYQAVRIARTEINRLYETANRQSQEYVTQKFGRQGAHTIWLHSGQVKGGRLGHILLHGERSGDDGMFWVGGDRAKGPHDPALPPGEVINCRCTTILWYDVWGPWEPRWPSGSQAADPSYPSPIHDQRLRALGGQPVASPGVVEAMAPTGWPRGDPTDVRRGGITGVVTNKAVVTFEDGSRGIWKPHHPDSDGWGTFSVWPEVAASRLDRALGLGAVPDTDWYVLDGSQGSMQRMIDRGDAAGGLTADQLEQAAHEFFRKDELKAQEMALLDYLMDNHDRHGRNIFEGEDQLWAIDNGLPGPYREKYAMGEGYPEHASWAVDEIDTQGLLDKVRTWPDITREDWFHLMSDGTDLGDKLAEESWQRYQQLRKEASE